MKNQPEEFDPNISIEKIKDAQELMNISISSSQKSIEYEDPNYFNLPRYSDRVIFLLRALGEDLDEKIPHGGEVKAIEKLVSIANKYLGN